MKNRIFLIFLIFFSLSFFSFGQNQKEQNLFLQNQPKPTQFDFQLFGNVDIFRVNIIEESLLFGTGLALNGTSFIIEKTRETKLPAFPFNIEDINPLDRKMVFAYSSSLHKISTVSCVAGLLTPGLLAFTTDSSEWLTISLMYAEAFLLANGIKELTKTLVYRPRPYMYFEGYPQKKIDEGDWDDSFFSGHTSLAFTGAAFTSYVFSKYNPDSPWRFAVAAGTYTLAAATGIMRVAGGNHFVTDVLVGAAVGTACGILVPWLHTKISGGQAGTPGTQSGSSGLLSGTKSSSARGFSSIAPQITPYSVGFSVKL